MVQKYLALFELLLQSTDTQRVTLLKSLSDPQLKALLEALYNVIKGTCVIRKKDKTELCRYKNVILRLISKELKPTQQKRLLKKHHRLIPLVLKSVIRFLKHD